MSSKEAELFDKISRIIQKIGESDAAGSKAAMDDPQTQGGSSSHPSADVEDDGEIQPAPEGEQTADNASTAKSDVPQGTDSAPDATPGNTPDQSDVQEDGASLTGEGEDEKPKDRPDDVPTAHPASAEIGEKYSSLQEVPTEELFKTAADLGNQLTAMIATGISEKSGDKTQPAGKKTADPNQAAKEGADAAVEATESDEIASSVVDAVVKSAEARADATVQYLTGYLQHLTKIAAEEEGGKKKAVAVDPTSEDVSDVLPEEDAAGDEVADEEAVANDDAAAEDILAAMAGGEAAPSEEEEDVLSPPGELDEMSEEALLQEILSALQEAGIGVDELADEGGDVGAKLASAAKGFRKAGKYELREAKKGSPQRVVRDYVKTYIRELCNRNAA